MATLDQVIKSEVTDKLKASYKQDKVASLSERSNLDPFGELAEVPGQKLGSYDFASLPNNKVGSFLDKMNLLNSDEVPSVDSLKLEELTANDDNVHQSIPRLQHSIWVGQPLNGDSEKKRAFMEQLVKNKEENPNWEVVLWTDQPREKFHQEPVPDDLKPMLEWARDNGIKLASIDEIYGHKDNQMQLHLERRLEQNKSGTGRAAASDIIRLEVLNRFGGIYVDGDKPFQVELDKVLDQAASAKIKIHGQGEEVSGFVAAQDLTRPQNCALCSAKGSPVTQAMLNQIQQEYGKTRQQLTSLGGVVAEKPRPQRVEVITRSGPTIISDVTAKSPTALMTSETIKSYTGTTSWSQEEPYSGYKRPGAIGGMSVTGTARLDNAEAITSIKDGAPVLPGLPPSDNLSEEQKQKIGKAIRGGLTSLCYTTANENGVLDLKHLQPHLAGLTADEQKLAVHGIIKSLGSDSFKGMRESVHSLSVPPNLGITKDSMDLLTDKELFKEMKLDNLCVQRAALRGDVALLKYAESKGVSLTTSTVRGIDTGTHQSFVAVEKAVAQYGKVTPLMAAVHSGNVEAVKFLMAHSHKGGFSQNELNDQCAALKLAGRLGQTEMMVAISEIGLHKINELAPDVDKQAHKDTLSTGVAEGVSNLGLVKEDVVRRVPQSPEAKLGAKLPDSAVLDQLSRNEGPLQRLGNNDIKDWLEGNTSFSEEEIQKIQNAGGGDLKAGVKNIIQAQRQHLALESDVAKNSTPSLIDRLAQNPELGNAVSQAVPEAYKTALATNNLEGFNELVAKGYTAVAGTPEQKQAIAENLLSKAAALGCSDPGDLAVKAQALGVDHELLTLATKQGNAPLVTATLNLNREQGNRLKVGVHDPQAEILIAQSRFPDAETVKNAAHTVIKNGGVATLNIDQARELARKGMAYAQERLDNQHTGKASRVTEWRNTMAEIKNTFPDDPTLKHLANQVDGKLATLQNSKQSVGETLKRFGERVKAKFEHKEDTGTPSVGSKLGKTTTTTSTPSQGKTVKV